jgi:hypothetical protein
MQLARFVRMFGLPLVLGLSSSGGGCGPGSSSPIPQEQSDRIKAAKKTSHQKIKEDAKEAKAAAQRGATRKGGRRGAAGP